MSTIGNDTGFPTPTFPPASHPAASHAAASHAAASHPAASHPAASPLAPAAAPSSASLAGLVAVVAFSLTVPATRVAAPALGGLLVGTGRAVIAGVLAAGMLAARRDPFPWAHLRGLGAVSAGVVVGFPICSALALEHVSGMHAVVVIGLLPLATAVVTALRGQERHRAGFWAASALGGATVVAYAWARGARSVEGADLLLILACLLAGVGYAEGAVLTRTLGGGRVIAWASVLALPLSLPLSALAVTLYPPQLTPPALLSLGWLGSVSGFLAFFAWYHALARGGVGRVGALQLLQPFFGVVWTACLVGEPLTRYELVAVGAIVPCILLARAFAAQPVTARAL